MHGTDAKVCCEILFILGLNVSNSSSRHRAGLGRKRADSRGSLLLAPENYFTSEVFKLPTLHVSLSFFGAERVLDKSWVTDFIILSRSAAKNVRIMCGMVAPTATWLLNYQSEHLLTSLTRTLKSWNMEIFRTIWKYHKGWIIHDLVAEQFWNQSVICHYQPCCQN